MVSSTIAQSSKIITLSYADRAKKAKNLNSPIAVARPVIRSQVPAVPAVPAISSAPSSNASTAPSTTTTTSTTSTIPLPPSTTASSASAPSVPHTATSSAIATRPPSPSPDIPKHSTPPTTSPNHTSSDRAVKALSIVEAHTSPTRPPVTNVWSLRMEQQTAARAPKPSHNSQSQSPSPPSESSQHTPPAKPHETTSSNLSHTTPTVSGTAQPNVLGPASAKSINDVTQADPANPASLDWPEVGKAPISSSSHPTSSAASVSEDTESHPPVTSRKSEKTKWVPIPPEELQAAADAMKRKSASSSRSQSLKGGARAQQQHRNNVNNTNNAPSSSAHDQASGSARQQNGRNYTAINNNNNNINNNSTNIPSGNNSVSQSRVQSRAGSTTSSPRVSRARRLPGDDHTDITPKVADSQQQRHNYHNQHPNRNGLQHGGGDLPPHPSDNNYLTGYAPYAPPPPPPHYFPQQLSSPRNEDSTSPPGAIVYPAPYPLYPPYGPAAASPSTTPPPPHAYWNAPRAYHPLPSSGHITPVYSPGPYPPPSALSVNAQHFLPRQAFTTNTSTETPGPPTTRIPPPSVSEPVTAYRPPPSTISTSNLDTTTSTKIPVVFGSIGNPGASQCPSPAPLRPSSDEEKENEGKKNRAFTIGVVSDELNGLDESTTKDKEADTSSAVSDSAAKWKFGTAGDVQEEPTGPTIVNGKVDNIIVHEPSTSLISAILKSPLLKPADAPTVGDEFEVKDFGYGFGDVSGTGNAPAITREERLARQQVQERERALEFELERKEQTAAASFDRTDVGVHPLPAPVLPPPLPQGSSSGGRGRRGGGGFGYEGRGGGFGGRRGGGRGGGVNGGGFFRGGYNNRNFNRGGFHNGPSHQRQGGFNVSPPHQFQSSIPVPPDVAAPPYFAPPPPRQQLATFIPAAYEAYPPPVPPPPPVIPLVIPQSGAPVPVPLSTLSFPLDPIRYYLLGQLEYYLSPQNMAQDFFLRQRMDSQGWIPISLIASFNRVQRLTVDEQLVRDVLTLSSLVQVSGDMVRMGRWEQFVLPDAPPGAYSGNMGYGDSQDRPFYERNSEYTGENEHREQAHGGPNNANSVNGSEVQVNGQSGIEQEIEGSSTEIVEEEDEEEDVVFVMGQEAGWSPELQRKENSSS